MCHDCIGLVLAGVEDFPIGAMVEAFGLSKIELNGLRGKAHGAFDDSAESSIVTQQILLGTQLAT